MFDITDEQILQATRYIPYPREGAFPDEWQQYDIAVARAILALKPSKVSVQVPMNLGGVVMCGYELFAGIMEDEVREVKNSVLIQFGSRDLLGAFLRWHDRTSGVERDLWCIHIPGPDEVHAAPSKDAADHVAAKHNAAMATYYASGATNLEFAPPIESVQAVAIKWPHDQQSHADELREFDWSAWGLTQENAS